MECPKCKGKISRLPDLPPVGTDSFLRKYRCVNEFCKKEFWLPTGKRLKVKNAPTNYKQEKMI